MEKQKKLLLLGGLRYIIPVIEAAHKQGYYVITCDYLPNNIAHRYSDEYHNISIIDKEAILDLARTLQIDGIMSFAVDPGVVTAAYVQKQMRLPAVGPYESVCILQNKDRFRDFLRQNGFNVPRAKSYGSIKTALAEKDSFPYPCIVKPTDSAGSKGVTRIDNPTNLKSALEFAFEHSLSKRIIIEEFIEKEGCSSDSDCFSINGELIFSSFSAQHFDENAPNPYTPSAFSWPSTMTQKQEAELVSELQRLLKLLKMQTSIYNVETRIGKNGKAYIMEVSPRGGGNRLSEMLRYATNVDLITASVRAAVGDNINNITPLRYRGHWAEIILHSTQSGTFKKINIDEIMKPYLIEQDIWVKQNQTISSFEGANDAIGTLIFNFDSEEMLASSIANQSQWLKILVE